MANWNGQGRNGRRITAVIFDLDDTLISWAEGPPWGETTRRHLHYLYTYLVAEGWPVPDERAFVDVIHDEIETAWERARDSHVAPGLGPMLANSLARMGIARERITTDELLRAYRWDVVPGVALYPDTLPVLDALRAEAYKIGLVTNAAMPMWMRDVELAAYGLMPYLDARITSGDTGYIKPHPAIYERILGLLDVSPDAAVFVGDSPAHDIAGANAAGLTSVLIDPPHLNRDRNGVEPDYTITSPAELLPILAQLEGR